MKNLIYYFTGTGNSLSVARVLADKLDGDTEIRAIANYLDRDEIIVEAEDTVGFIFPIYGSDTPWPVKAVAAKMKIDPSVFIYAIGTCNERGGCCMDYFGSFMKKYGYIVSYAKKLDMPGNCMESNAGENQERLELEDFRVSIFAKNINRRFVSSVEDFDFPENTVEGNRAKYADHPISKFYVDAEKCARCGICAKLCPMDNIKLPGTDDLPVFGADCAVCFGCFHFCPSEAIYKDMGDGLTTLNHRTRYHHPDVSWQDIAMQRERI